MASSKLRFAFVLSASIAICYAKRYIAIKIDYKEKEMLKTTFLGHSAFLFDDGVHKVIIDPFITGNPSAKIKAKDIKADYVILSHGHGDHFGDAVEISQKCGAQCIAVFELANILQREGANAHPMHIGGKKEFPFGKIKFTIAQHGSSIASGEYAGLAAGIILEMGGKKIYHTGDTGLFLDMKLIGEMNKIDAMFLPIGDNFTMGIDDAVKAVEFVKPNVAIPMHYNTFSIIEANPEEFKSKIEKNNFACKIMEVGETFKI